MGDLLLCESVQRRNAEVLILDVDGAGAADLDMWTLVAVALPEDLRILALTKGESDAILKALVAQSRLVRGIHAINSHPGEITRAVCRISSGIRSDDPGIIAKMKLALMNLKDRNGRIAIGALEFDLEKQVFWREGRSGELTSLETSVLDYLARRRGIPVSAYELLATVWGNTPADGGTLDQVKSCIWRIRQKIEPRPKSPRFLVQLRGKGYLLAASHNR